MLVRMTTVAKVLGVGRLAACEYARRAGVQPRRIRDKGPWYCLWAEAVRVLEVALPAKVARKERDAARDRLRRRCDHWGERGSGAPCDDAVPPSEGAGPEPAPHPPSHRLEND